MEFYRQISHKNINVASSILIDVMPDSCNTYVGRLIDQNGSIWSFDVDLDDCSFSEWDDITDELNQLLKKNKNSKKYILEFYAKEIADKSR